tara:strand:- start:210 stop:953 length:744 start_codon:yes stop_codon:yes gene_type:complete
MAYPYISSNISGNLGEQLFQIANVFKFVKESRKNKIRRKVLFKKDENRYWDTIFHGIFKIYDEGVYNNIEFFELSDDLEKYYESKSNIKLVNCCNVFHDNIKEMMVRIIYNDEDLMYGAYYKYRNILDHFGEDTNDNDMVSIDYDNKVDKEYYINGIEHAGIKNLVIFCKNKDECKKVFSNGKYNIYYVENMDACNELILFSMFKNNIISGSTNTLWASYISHYDNKIVVAPEIMKDNGYNNITTYL